MRIQAWIGVLVATMIAGVVMAAGKHHTPSYILNGYSFGIPGVNTAELEAKLKQKAGARITAADVDADQAIIQKEIEERHIQGQIIATTAEKHGRVWIIFDLLNLPTSSANRVRHLELQSFEGDFRISASTLAAATGLKTGDQLSPQNLNAARRAILAAYAATMPGKAISLKARMQTRLDGRTTITWIVTEPK
jgi:hypothetical protein